MSDQAKLLTDLGLSEHEANLYLTTLKLGGATASQIAKESGIQRTHSYPILKSLASKGFANVYFKSNKRFYYASKPEKIRLLFEKKISAFNELIPQLNALDKSTIGIIGLRFIETKKELKHFYNEVLLDYSLKIPSKKEYYIIGNSIFWENILGKYFRHYRAERANLGIRTKLILSNDSSITPQPTRELLRQFKYLDEKYKFKSTIDIFDDKILIVSPSLSSLAVVIAIPAMVDIFKSIFDIFWDNF